MWFGYALATIFMWGGSDLFSKMGTDTKDRYSHFRLVIAVGAVMGVHAIGYILFTGIKFDPVNIIRYFPVSFLYILSMTLGYAGLRYIELSVSSPVCNSSGAVTAILCFVFLGQRMTNFQLAAVLLIMAGILALSIFEKKGAIVTETDRKYRVGVLAILFPLLYCVIDGLGSFMDAFYLENWMDEAQANLSYEFTFLLAAIGSFLYLKFVRKANFSIVREKKFFLAALCETAGQFTYIYAMADNAIVAAPMIASYSVLSVLLSNIFLKEKLRAAQYAAIALVMIGVAILGME